MLTFYHRHVLATFYKIMCVYLFRLIRDGKTFITQPFWFLAGGVFVYLFWFFRFICRTSYQQQEERISSNRIINNE